MPFSTLLLSRWKGCHNVLQHFFGSVLLTLPDSRTWQDVFRVHYFYRGSKIRRLVLQHRATGRARWCPRNEKLVCLEKLSWEFAWKSVLCEQLLRTSMYVMAVTMKALRTRHSDFHVSNIARCSRRTWRARWHDLVMADHFLGACKMQNIRNTFYKYWILRTVNSGVYSRDD
jgi:hypothetical protein